MNHHDELDQILTRGADGPDGELADLLTRIRSAGLASAPVPTRSLAAVLVAGPVDLLTPEDLARSPLPRPPSGPRARVVGRLSALTPATRLLLAGSVAAAVVTGAVLAVDELSQDRRLRLDIVTPATSSSGSATSGPVPSTSATSSSGPSTSATSGQAPTGPATSRPAGSRPARSSPAPATTRGSAPVVGGPAPRSSTSSRSSSPDPRSTSDDASPRPTSSSATETETTDPGSDPSSAESTRGSGGRGSGSDGSASASEQAGDSGVEAVATGPAEP